MVVDAMVPFSRRWQPAASMMAPDIPAMQLHERHRTAKPSMTASRGTMEAFARAVLEELEVFLPKEQRARDRVCPLAPAAAAIGAGERKRRVRHQLHRAIQLALHHRTLQRAQPVRAQRAMSSS